MRSNLWIGLCLILNPVYCSALELGFDVYLDDKRIGEHRVQIQQDGPERNVSVQADMTVNVLFIKAFNYQHQANEQWRNDCIVGLETQTRENSDQYRVQAAPSPSATESDTMLVTTLQGEREVEGCMRTFAYWDLNLLNQTALLNTQNGDLETTELIANGAGSLSFMGRELGTQRYQLRVNGKPDILLWYDAEGQWVALETEVRSGRMLRYIHQQG